jgi:hypothetical protein
MVRCHVQGGTYSFSRRSCLRAAGCASETIPIDMAACQRPCSLQEAAGETPRHGGNGLPFPHCGTGLTVLRAGRRGDYHSPYRQRGSIRRQPTAHIGGVKSGAIDRLLAPIAAKDDRTGKLLVKKRH